MLRWRLISAAVILSVLLGLMAVDFFAPLFGASGLVLVPIGLAAALMGADEVLDLLASKELRPVGWAVRVGTLMIFLAACAPLAWPLFGKAYPPDCPLGKLGWPLAAAALAVMLIFFAEMRRYEKPGGVIVNVALGVFATSYVGLLMSFIVALRMFHDHLWGMAALISTVLVVKLSDTGAYTFGRLFGKHKMAPVLSPGKTIEGAIGGLCTACVASVLFFRFAVPAMVGEDADAGPWWGWIIYGAVLTAAGMIGDLAESLLKRDMDRKDSSRWLPGLGGVLDIIDSILFAAAPAYLCWVGGIVGPE